MATRGFSVSARARRTPVEADHRGGVALARGRKHGPDRDVVHRLDVCRDELLLIVRREPDQRVVAGQQTCLPRRQIFLADVHAVPPHLAAPARRGHSGSNAPWSSLRGPPPRASPAHPRRPLRLRFVCCDTAESRLLRRQAPAQSGATGCGAPADPLPALAAPSPRRESDTAPGTSV